MPLKIKATIIINSTVPWCDSDCAIDWSRQEQQTQALNEIEKRYGDEVRLDFVDITNTSDKSEQLMTIQESKSGALPLSTLLINDVPRIVGAFDMRMLLDVIEAEIDREL